MAKRKRELLLAEIFETAAKDFEEVGKLLRKLAALDAPKRSEPWTRLEIANLEAAIAVHGFDADKVCEVLPARSKAEVKRKVATWKAAAGKPKEVKEEEKEEVTDVEDKRGAKPSKKKHKTSTKEQTEEASHSRERTPKKEKATKAPSKSPGRPKDKERDEPDKDSRGKDKAKALKKKKKSADKASPVHQDTSGSEAEEDEGAE